MRYHGAVSDDLRAVLRDPPVGIFNARSWSFWHLRLGFDAVPDLPRRRPLTLSAAMNGTSVKVSFFGTIGFGRVGHPDRTADGGPWVASLLDLFGIKLKVLLQRVAARDYLDLAAILRAGLPLPDGLGAARALFGNEFPPMEAVKTLAYFDEGEAVNVPPGNAPLPDSAGSRMGLYREPDRPGRRVRRRHTSCMIGWLIGG